MVQPELPVSIHPPVTTPPVSEPLVSVPVTVVPVNCSVLPAGVPDCTLKFNVPDTALVVVSTVSVA